MTGRSPSAGGTGNGQSSPDTEPPAEDYRLARWVRAVVLRWTVTGVPARDRACLFAGLLHELVAARIERTGIGRLVDVAPETFADQLAATERLSTPSPAPRPRLKRPSAGRRPRPFGPAR